MVHQDDAAVVNEQLAGEEIQGLHHFANHIGLTQWVCGPAGKPRQDGQVRNGDGRRIGLDDTANAAAQQDHRHRSAQAYRPLQDHVRGQRPEPVSALKIAATRAQRNVERGPNGDDGDQIGTGEIQIIRDRMLEEKQKHARQGPACPPRAVKAAIYRAFPLRRALLRHHLRGDDLERESYGGQNRQKRVDDGRMTEPDGPQKSGNRHVVRQVDGRRHARARQQHDASRDDTRLERLCVLRQYIH